jgi:pimeloyl-ACP methyl ester carboxylesterase
MPGELIDVGGHRLYVNCTGTGSPTVVLEAGLGESSAYWGRIATAVARDAQVCVYDRAGRGQSEPASGPQDGVAIADDLHALLEGAQLDGPYLLVGHSSGGVYIRIFASQYPDEVAGMVLLDAQPVEALTRLPGYPSSYRGARTISALLPTLARLGVTNVAVARSVRDEWAELPTALQQGAALTSLGDRPLVVVTAVVGAQTGWLPLQDEMVNLSTNSVHRLVPDATHSSLITSEGDAAISSQAILDVVESVRTGTPLASS